MRSVASINFRLFKSTNTVFSTFFNMFRKCCVPKCNSLRQDVKFHQFPIKEENKRQWLKCINCESIMHSDVSKLYVCHKHFEQKFVNVATNRLKSGAYPSLFSALEISSENPTSVCFETDNKKTTCSDHSYSRKRHIDHSYALPVHSKHTPNIVASTEVFDISVQPSTSSHQTNATCMSLSNTVQMTSDISLVPTTVQNITTDSIITLNAAGSSCKTPQKLLKRRLIRDVKSLTPRCRLLYKEYKKAKLQSNYKSRVKKALSFSKEKSLEELTKNMNPLSRKILWMQVKLCTKSKKARRFTTEEKLIALSIYKQGPKSYKFLQKIFILPSKTTLKKMISQLNIGPGINPQIFELIKNQIHNWDESKRLCTVMFDEMALETALTYSAPKDNIVGFVHLNGKTKQFADHALVFLLRGAVCKWQQPLAFYFCEGATSSLQLKPIIKDIIAAVTDTGLTPIALVSDQGSSFQSTINNLLEETKRDQLRAGEPIDNTIHLSGNSLSMFYDPPHLIKGIRNNFLSKDLYFEGKRATWQDIVDVYNADCKHGESRILHRLTDQHVIPEKIKKMKVKNCVRVLSKSVAAALSYTSSFPMYPDGTPVSATLKNTAEAISFFDDLFDSVNGASTLHKNTKCKILRKAVTAKSRHHEFWNRAIKTIEGTKFITKDNKVKSVPSVKNWVITLKSFKRVWGVLKTKNIKIMRPRYFNSDPIENFFGQVRAYNYRSNDPSPYAFVNTFKSLLITRFLNFHSENYNCEDEVSKDLLTIQSLFNITNDVNTAPTPEQSVSSTKDFDHDLIQVQARRERMHVHSRAYTAGWVTRKILNKINCEHCKSNLVTEDVTNIHAYIRQKEYKTIKQNKLSYPSEYVVRSFGHIINTTNEYLELHGHENQISHKIKQKLCSEYSFDFLDCELHKEIVLEDFLNLSIRLFIFNWCNVINKILKGTDIIRLERMALPQMQQNAYNKYKKKLKNKNINK